MMRLEQVMENQIMSFCPWQPFRLNWPFIYVMGAFFADVFTSVEETADHCSKRVIPLFQNFKRKSCAKLQFI